jgi:hypothetical protein
MAGSLGRTISPGFPIGPVRRTRREVGASDVAPDRFSEEAPSSFDDALASVVGEVGGRRRVEPECLAHLGEHGILHPGPGRFRHW